MAETPTAEQVAETIERRVPEGLQAVTTNPMGMRNLAMAERRIAAEKRPERELLTLTGIAVELETKARKTMAEAKAALQDGNDMLHDLTIGECNGAIYARDLVLDLLAQEASQPDELRQLRAAVRRAEARLEQFDEWNTLTMLHAQDILREETGDLMGEPLTKLPPGVPDARD